MQYLIDGYNLMFRVDQEAEDLQVQRERLIRNLDQKFAKLHLKGKIIFDAHLQEGEGATEYAKNLEIYYTARFQTADEAILDLLKGLKASGWVIITSDRGLALQVRREGFKTNSVEHFFSWLKKKTQTKKQVREHYSPPPILPQPKKKTPTLQALPDDCLDYYLEIFQKEPQPELEKNTTKRKKKLSTKKEAPSLEKGLSDFERWLKFFQQGDRPS